MSAFKGAIGRWRKVVTRQLIGGIVRAVDKLFFKGTEITLTAAQLLTANRETVITRIGQIATESFPVKVSVLGVPAAATLQKALFVPDEDSNTSANSWALSLINAGTLGTGTAAIASLDLSAAVANLTGYRVRDLGSLSNATLAASGAVAAEVSLKGTGSTFPGGAVILEFTRD
jgi:hypothetical protein